jgi:glycosyltransferase involved in cell wall biosynthesis
MKVALVHDLLVQYGGAEKVLKVLEEIYPEAPIFTLVFNERKMGRFFNDRKIKTSFLQNLPFGSSAYRWYLPLMPTATESYNLMDYDLVISSSSAFAKGAITSEQTLHLCYCHTPTRYLWTDTHQYIEGLSYPNLIKKIIPLTLNRLRVWDYLSAKRPDYFIANSENVRRRIKKFYGRESFVIQPPLEIENFKISKKVENYFLTGGRLVPYKKFDLTVIAFNRLGIPLKVFGTGPEEQKLKKIAKANIEFLGFVSEKDLAKLYSQALAFIHPQVEDFGITAIEAMASGRPVIAYQVGGSLESVKEGETGLFFDEQSWEAIVDAILRFKPENFNPQAIREHAKNFDKENFKKRIKEFVNEKWSEFNK